MYCKYQFLALIALIVLAVVGVMLTLDTEIKVVFWQHLNNSCWRDGRQHVTENNFVAYTGCYEDWYPLLMLLEIIVSNKVFGFTIHLPLDYLFLHRYGVFIIYLLNDPF